MKSSETRREGQASTNKYSGTVIKHLEGFHMLTQAIQMCDSSADMILSTYKINQKTAEK